ncbi:MAG TPA: hypothetical protein VFT45_11765 [Longimicrobium sp.]|nr:hypothetical protein [Longimicrobium sp.]
MKITLKSLRPAIGIALSILAASGGCQDEGSRTAGDSDSSAKHTAVADSGTQFVVAVDLSTSLTATERASHEALLHALVAELNYGDRLVLLKTHAAGIRDTSTARMVTMPTPRGTHPLQREKDELELARQTADLYVTSLFKTPPINGSDLFATMHSAGERAREATGGRKVLVVLSDMLQCTTAVCMEQAGGLPDSAWIAGQKQQGLVPQLDGVCVSIVGVDATTAQGVSVREFWRHYFQTAGAEFNPQRYVHSASSPGVLRCES